MIINKKDFDLFGYQAWNVVSVVFGPIIFFYG